MGHNRVLLKYGFAKPYFQRAIEPYLVFPIHYIMLGKNVKEKRCLNSMEQWDIIALIFQSKQWDAIR